MANFAKKKLVDECTRMDLGGLYVDPAGAWREIMTIGH